MTINMQGAWTIKVVGKNAVFPQRFRIAGASAGNGDHEGTIGAEVFVNGPTWGLTIESAPTGALSWTPSRVRMTSFRTESDGSFRFRLTSDDVGAGLSRDADHDDLVLECSMLLAETELVIYGRVQTYDPPCLFNPCYPPSFWVVETGRQLEQLLENPAAKRVLEQLYGEQVQRKLRRQPDADRFKPMMIPTGEAEPPALVVRGRRSARADLVGGRVVANRPTLATRLPQPLVPQSSACAGMLDEPGALRARRSMLAASDLLALAHLRDRMRLFCRGTPLPQTLLRVLEYDRTTAERLGGPYSGTGPRARLGVTATDDSGWYVFRFSRSVADFATEWADVESSEDPALVLRPDLILQVLEDLPEGVVYESPAYFDVANVRRIDVCFDKDLWGQPSTACQGGRAVQALGDLMLHDPATELHADGTVSNRGSSGPRLEHAAWRGVIHLYACFLATTPKVHWYTIRYRRSGESSWGWVTEPYRHLHQRADGSWESALVGPLPGVALHVGGPTQPALATPAFLNIEDDIRWLASHRHRKACLSTALYQAGAGLVEFRIEGWDASGKQVSGASDSVQLYLDNHQVSGAIASVRHADQPFNSCALIELANATAPLEVELRVDDPEGFLSRWALVVYRGSNTELAIEQPSGEPVGAHYQDLAPFRLVGTGPLADASGYVRYTVIPRTGRWLPPEHDFCAFSFELHVEERTTDGRVTPSSFTLWRELVGIATIT